MLMIDQLEQQGKKLVDKIKKLQSSSTDGFQNIHLNESYPDVPIANISAKTFNNTRLLDQKISELNKLKVEYNKAVDEYSLYLANSTQSARNYIARTDPNNTYLNKNIQFSDGKTMYVTQQGMAKLYEYPSVFQTTAGKNGCPLPKDVIKLNHNDPNYNKPGFNLDTIKPVLKVGTNMKAGQTCGKEGQNVFVNTILSKTPSQTYYGCFGDDPVDRTMTFIGNTPGNNSSPDFDYNDCKNSAMHEGYRYFSLQGIDSKTGKGYCAVGNDLSRATKKGKAIITNKFPLWSSNTKSLGKALLQNTGSLVVFSYSGSISWTSPPLSSCVQMYSTTKNSDSGGNDIDFLTGTVDDCKTQCNKMNNCGGFAYDNNGKFCYIKSGKLKPTGKNANLTLYKKSVDTASCNFYLILQNDGNMCIYKGNGPSSNPGNSVWCTHTNGKKQMPNSEWVSSKGKYQRNYLMAGETLEPGEWIGSDDGSLKLIFEKEGSLVLYTSSQVENCRKSSSGNIVGGLNANAIYDLGTTGFPKNMGKLGFVDENGILKQYPDSMIDKPASTSKSRKNTTLSIPKLKNPPSCPTEIATIDSVEWENYPNSGEKMNSNTDCANGELDVTRDEKLMLSEKRMKELSKKISYETDYLLSNRLSVKQQTTMNSITLNSALVSSFPVQYDDNTTNIQKYKKANSAFREGFNSDSNINKIVQDSHIRVMQENYEYILWGALAITTVVVFIKLLKN